MMTGAKLMNQRGFTLIELLFTMVIVAIALLAYIRGNIAISQASSLAYEQSVAFYDAQRVLENIRNTAQSGTFPSNVTTAYANGAAVAGFNNLTSESLTVSYANPSADPLDVTVTVTWQGNGRRTMTMTKAIRSLVTQRKTS